jgi:hypothetical protein
MSRSILALDIGNAAGIEPARQTLKNDLRIHGRAA